MSMSININIYFILNSFPVKNPVPGNPCYIVEHCVYFIIISEIVYENEDL